MVRITRLFGYLTLLALVGCGGLEEDASSLGFVEQALTPDGGVSGTTCKPPTIKVHWQSTHAPKPGGKVSLVATAKDPAGKRLSFVWRASGGSIAQHSFGTASSAIWSAPRKGCLHKVKLTVRNRCGAKARHTFHLASCQPTLYFTKTFFKTFQTGGSISSMKHNGTAETLLVGNLDKPVELVVDLKGGTIYFTIWGNSGQVKKVKLDGSGLTSLYNGQMGGVGIDIDPATGKLYWGMYYYGLSKGNMDGSGSSTMLVPSSLLRPANGLSVGLSMDRAKQQVYFVTRQNGAGNWQGRKVWRVNADGTGLQMIRQLKESNCLALDLVHRKIYFSDSDNYPSDGAPEAIWRMDMDGKNAKKIMTLTGVHNSCTSLEIDPYHRKMYIIAHGNPPVSPTVPTKVLKTSLNGKNAKVLKSWSGGGFGAGGGSLALAYQSQP